MIRVQAGYWQGVKLVVVAVIVAELLRGGVSTIVRSVGVG